MAKDESPGRKVIARNRRATHDYFIDERFEAGLMLVGTEVKSLRDGRATINEAYAAEQDGEIFLVNATISEYRGGNRFNHEPRRPRKLLLKRKEMNKLAGAVKKKGQTIIPLSLYFNPRASPSSRSASPAANPRWTSATASRTGTGSAKKSSSSRRAFATDS